MARPQQAHVAALHRTFRHPAEDGKACILGGPEHNIDLSAAVLGTGTKADQPPGRHQAGVAREDQVGKTGNGRHVAHVGSGFRERIPQHAMLLPRPGRVGASAVLKRVLADPIAWHDAEVLRACQKHLLQFAIFAVGTVGCCPELRKGGATYGIEKA